VNVWLARAGGEVVQAAYLAVTLTAAACYAYAAVLNFTHSKSVAETAVRLGVPTSWMVRLGVLLAAGSIGLVVGLAVHAVGTAAACGLVLYFGCASAAHIRARDRQIAGWANWAAFFLLAVATLVVGLSYGGHW
jgi:hypothetical protein